METLSELLSPLHHGVVWLWGVEGWLMWDCCKSGKVPHTRCKSCTARTYNFLNCYKVWEEFLSSAPYVWSDLESVGRSCHGKGLKALPASWAKWSFTDSWNKMSTLLPCLREQGAVFVQPMNGFISVVLKKTGLSPGSLPKEKSLESGRGARCSSWGTGMIQSLNYSQARAWKLSLQLFVSYGNSYCTEEHSKWLVLVLSSRAAQCWRDFILYLLFF